MMKTTTNPYMQFALPLLLFFITTSFQTWEEMDLKDIHESTCVELTQLNAPIRKYHAYSILWSPDAEVCPQILLDTALLNPDTITWRDKMPDLLELGYDADTLLRYVLFLSPSMENQCYRPDIQTVCCPSVLILDYTQSELTKIRAYQIFEPSYNASLLCTMQYIIESGSYQKVIVKEDYVFNSNQTKVSYRKTKTESTTLNWKDCLIIY